MARRQDFLGAEFSNRFRESYLRLSHDRKRGADKAILALMKQETTPGMRVKPIEPDRYFHEARINDGDRLIYRIRDGIVWLVDVVSHDDIGRYGKRMEGLFRKSRV